MVSGYIIYEAVRTLSDEESPEQMMESHFSVNTDKSNEKTLTNISRATPNYKKV